MKRDNKWSDRDNVGKGMTKEDVEAHLQRVRQRHREVRSLVDETNAARARLLEKIVAQNLDRLLVAESITRLEAAFRVGFDPAHTNWPPPVVTVYIEPFEMIGHARILVEELFLDSQEIVNWDHQLADANHLLNGLFEKYGEPLFSKIITTLEELHLQIDRAISTIERKQGLAANEFREQTFYEYADYILPARDEIEFALEGLRLGGFGKRLDEVRRKLAGLDERLRKSLLDTLDRYVEARKYGLTGSDLEYSPQSFWWRRLAATRSGDPVWR